MYLDKHYTNKQLVCKQKLAMQKHCGKKKRNLYVKNTKID